MDLALTGGHLIDPRTSRSGKIDIAFADGLLIDGRFWPADG